MSLKSKNKLACSENFHNWATGAGALLGGVAAFVAAYHTAYVLQTVLNIQKKAENIETILTQANNLSKKSAALNLVLEQSSNTSPAVEDKTMELLSENADFKRGQVYLPKLAIPEVQKILKDPTLSKNQKTNLLSDKFRIYGME